MPTFRQDPKMGGLVPLMKTDDINDQAVTNRKIAAESVSREKLTSDIRSSIDKKADAEEVNSALVNLENKIGKRYVVEGDVTNFPDDEDLVSVKEEGKDVLKFADKTYDPQKFSGKGHKILRKNIKLVSLAVAKITIETPPTSDGSLTFSINGKEAQVVLSVEADNTIALVAKKIAYILKETMTDYEVLLDAAVITLARKYNGSEVLDSSIRSNTTGVICTIVDSFKKEFRNLLTSTMINLPNTIYEIRYDFDLDGQNVKVPENCVIKFKGGSINNGSLAGNNTELTGNLSYKISVSGSFKSINREYDSTINMLKDHLLLPGMTASTHGYYKANDNGGAKFIIVIDKPTGGEFGLQLSNGLYAKYIAEGDIRASQFGARTLKEDGVTPFDSTEALQAGIDFVTRRNSGFADNRTISRSLIIDGFFYTNTLKINTNIATSNPPLTIKGYGIWKTALYYIGNEGYKGVFTSEEALDTSSILEVNAGNNLHIEGIAFYGGHWENNRPINYASYCIYVNGSLDEGFICHNCLFASCVLAGIGVKNDAWNFHLHELRFDNTGKYCVSINGDTLMSFVLSDFTVDCALARVNDNDLSVKFLKDLPWLTFDGFTYSIYNSLLYVKKGIDDTKIKIANARLEGKPIGYANNPACLVKFGSASMSTVVEFSNIDDSLSTKDCIICIDRKQQVLPTVVGRIGNSKDPMYQIGDDKFLNSPTDLFASKPCQNFYPRVSDYSVNGGDTANSHDRRYNALFSLYGKGLSIKSVIYDSSDVKYGDIIWRDRQVDGTYRIDRYSDRHVGYICVYPRKGIAYNYHREQMQRILPVEFVSVGNNYIQTNEKLTVYYSYTITYDNGETDDFMCTSSVKQKDSTYYNYFKFDVFKPYRKVVKICRSGAIWKPFGFKELSTYFGEKSARVIDNTDETGSMFFDTDLHLPNFLQDKTWLLPNGIHADTYTYLDSYKTLSPTYGSILYDALNKQLVYKAETHIDWKIGFNTVNVVDGCDIAIILDGKKYIIPVPEKFFAYGMIQSTNNTQTLTSYLRYTCGLLFFDKWTFKTDSQYLILSPLDGNINHTVDISFSNTQIEGAVASTPSTKADAWKTIDNLPVNIRRYGTTELRPNTNILYPGFTFYDTSLNKLIICSGKYRCIWAFRNSATYHSTIGINIDGKDVVVNIPKDTAASNIVSLIKDKLNENLSDYYLIQASGNELVITSKNKETHPINVIWSNNTDVIIRFMSSGVLNGMWITADGEPADAKTSGTFSEKPSSSLNISVGFPYFCTDRSTSEGSTNGIMIYHKGNNVWVDALGRIVN